MVKVVHYKALMKKNWINWKRTPCGSCCEIFCPLICMMLFASLRRLFDIEEVTGELLYKESLLQSPITIKRDDNGTAINLKELYEFNQDIIYFLGLGENQTETWDCERRGDSFRPCKEWQDINLNQSLLGLTYDHCYESDRDGREDASIVGVIHDGNEIGQKMEEELRLLVKFQKQIYDNRREQYIKLFGQPGDKKERVKSIRVMQFMLSNWSAPENSTEEELEKNEKFKEFTENKYEKLIHLGRRPIDFQIKNFTTKDELFAYIQDPKYRAANMSTPGVCFAIAINELKNKKGYDVEILLNDQIGEQRWTGLPSQLIKPFDNYITIPSLRTFQLYSKDGYSKLHNWAANLILRQKFKEEKNGRLPTISNLIVPMRGGDYIEDSFGRILPLLSFFLFLIFIIPLYRLTYRIVNEKETRSRESMKMMGLTDTSYWLSWFTYHGLIIFITSLIIVGVVGRVLKTQKSLLFVIIFTYGMNLFGIALVMQSLIGKPWKAGLLACTIYFVTYFLDQLVNKPFHSYVEKTAFSVLAPVAIQRIMTVMSVAENARGLRFENIKEEYQHYVVRDGILAMVFSTIFLMLFGLYLDNVIQQQFGTAKKWNYCCSLRYWGCRKKQYRKVSDPYEFNDKEEEREDYYMDKKNYQPVNNPELLAQEKEQNILKIVGLKKNFGDFQAVRGVNVKMYNGQIFALLGHNGAGKTTTISMLTGLITASEGKGKIYNKDLFGEMDDVRQFMGVCPQHDVLFDLLTPEEHLDVFCDFKGVPKKEKKQQIEKIMKDIELYQFKYSRAGQLSGGNKRKLSIAIALIGGSKFILLDEPTAGIDLTGRRKMWDMLKAYKNNRIIILTTHYMDEADILGDRIGIMAKGQIICLGRSLFLKNRFGVGYRLSMVKKSKKPNKKVGKFLENKLGNSVQKMSEVSSEITYQIPKELSGNFKQFFQQFDQMIGQLGILSYGISVTTLEEVFLRVGHGIVENNEENADNEHSQQIEKRKDLKTKQKEMLDAYNEKASVQYTSPKIWHQFVAILLRRLQVYKKNKALLTEIGVPVILVIIGLSFSFVQFFVQSPQRVIVPDSYELKQDIMYNNELLVKRGNGDIEPIQLMKSLPDQINSFNLQQFTTYAEKDKNKYNQSLIDFSAEIFNKQNEQPPYRYGSYFIIEADNDTKSFKTATFINLTSQDAAAYFPQFLYQSILRQATGDPEFVFNVTTTAFPVSQQLKDRDVSSDALFVSIISGIGFSLIPATVIQNIVYERQKGLKHIQVVSGLSLVSYWGANYVFDVIKSSIPCFISVCFFYIFNMGFDHFWTTVMFYPFGMVSFAYAISFLFSTESAAQSTMLFGNIVAGSVVPMVTFVLRIITSTMNDGDAVIKYMRIVPNFSISNSIIYDASSELFNNSRRTATLAQEQKNDTSEPKINPITLEPFDSSNIGGDLYALMLHLFAGIGVVILIESTSFLFAFLQRKKSSNVKRQLPAGFEMDDDVIKEENRVENLDQMQCLVKVQGLRKVYKNTFGKGKVAIQKTSFAIDRGECFALLGVNGAGKTTTFKSLTKDVVPSAGMLTVLGYDIHSEFEKARKYIGYCPQYDTIYDLLTVKEHIEFQMAIKGIPIIDREQTLESSLDNLSLTEYRDKNAGTLSGGNKRKLSVAMALIGNPPVILLDEPSAGMDPEARRFMWGVIAKVSQQQKHSGVIITTHSMEEAEALCTKMGIQVEGGIFRCFGSSQHIKNKFATGYEIEVKFKSLTDNEIVGLKQEFGLDTKLEKTDLSKLLDIMDKNKVDNFLVNEMHQFGYGGDLVLQQHFQGNIDAIQAIQWLHNESFGLQFIKFLVNVFGEVEVLEHVNDFFKLRVPKQDTTIGYTFGIIEDKKDDFRIQEYSVSQTTLEQIFQTFAKIRVQDSINKNVFKLEKDLDNEKQIINLYKTRGSIIDIPTIINPNEWADNFREILRRIPQYSPDTKGDDEQEDNQLIKNQI